MNVAQLIEQSLPTPEVHSSNPVNGKFSVNYQLFWKDEAGNGTLLKLLTDRESIDETAKESIIFSFPIKLFYGHEWEVDGPEIGEGCEGGEGKRGHRTWRGSGAR